MQTGRNVLSVDPERAFLFFLQDLENFFQDNRHSLVQVLLNHQKGFALLMVEVLFYGHNEAIKQNNTKPKPNIRRK
jgi:hypothetical protein